MSRAAMSPACAELLNAFNPGSGSLLRTCAERRWNVPGAAGERITLDFDLDGDVARQRAYALERDVGRVVNALQLGRYAQRVVYATAWVGAGGIFTIDALVLQA